MATFMSTNFTAGDRRKKVVTYGKSSRLPSKSTQQPSNDAPSPERAYKLTATSNAKTGIPDQTCGAIETTYVPRANSQDIFDVPSEDEFVAQPPKPTRNLQGNRNRPTETTNGQAKRSLPPKKSIAPPPKHLSKSTLPPKPIPSHRSAHHGGATKPEKDITKPTPKENARLVRATDLKRVPRATSPRPPVTKTRKVTNSGSKAVHSGDLSTKLAPSSDEMDIFDLPSSGDESYLPTPRPVRNVTFGRNEPAHVRQSEKDLFPSDAAESEDSNKSNNRKRKGPISDALSAKSLISDANATALAQRNHKIRKTDAVVSPGPEARRETLRADAPAINKPKRTRIRTVSVIDRSQVAKGQSSPAALQNLLPTRDAVEPRDQTVDFDAVAQEHDTMYDIPEYPTTPARPSSNTASGSVTPRQKALFGNLLGTTSSSATPMPNISSLQLTASKPRSLLGALSRSKSDITNNAPLRRTKLLDSLKPVGSSSDEESSGSDSASDDEEEMQDSERMGHEIKRTNNAATATKQTSATVSFEGDRESAAASTSQTSQVSMGSALGRKLTYAKSRSYLEESNAEDALLISMDLDDPIAFGSQRRDEREEEEEEASQVRANHELKRQGQQNTFEWEMLIDDMSTSSGSGVRRSAMLEFCTKMASEAFTHQLLDSTLAQRFLKHMSSNGETIYDFAATVATVFMLRSRPTFTMLEQIHRSDSNQSMLKLLKDDRDIQRIARDRKTNLSKIAQETVSTFRALVQNDSLWAPWKPLVVSPQLLVLKALELEVLGSRRAGAFETIVDHDTVNQLIDILSRTCNGLDSSMDLSQAQMTIEIILSTLEALASTKTNQPTWSYESLQLLATSMPVCFAADSGSRLMLAVKLCMNLTNNKSRACQEFSGPPLVQGLSRAIVGLFRQLQDGVIEERRVEVLDSLILSLGAMINLAEHSDEARIHVGEDKELVETLVKTFLEGSARAAQAESMEESQSSVAVGYLSVLLGNMCLNDGIQSQVRALLPGQSLETLVQEIKEFVRIHEHVNRKAKQYEGDEGQQTWQEYTARLLQVVEKLGRAQGR